MIRLYLDRRGALAGLVASALPGPALAAKSEDPIMRVALLGQALIHDDLCADGWPGMTEIKAVLGKSHVVFTDLETAIDGPGAGPPTRVGEVMHAAPPSVIDCLKYLGVSIVTTANNHAWDLGSGGIVAAIEALDERGIRHAGTGRNIEEAAAPAYQETPSGTFALVSAAAGAIREGAAATTFRPGVAELRRLPTGELDPSDVQRTMESIRTAKATGATVLFCLHNHYWEPDLSQTPDWQRHFARKCVDAGAAAFVAHGTPLMQGTESYRSAPLFHGLGSFIFQTRKPDEAYSDVNFRSMIVNASFQNGRFVSADLVPLRLSRERLASGHIAGFPEIVRETLTSTD